MKNVSDSHCDEKEDLSEESNTVQDIINGDRDIRVCGPEFHVNGKWIEERSVKASLIQIWRKKFKRSPPFCMNCEEVVTGVSTDPHFTCARCVGVVHCKCAFVPLKVWKQIDDCTCIKCRGYTISEDKVMLMARKNKNGEFELLFNGIGWVPMTDAILGNSLGISCSNDSSTARKYSS